MRWLGPSPPGFPRRAAIAPFAIAAVGLIVCLAAAGCRHAPPPVQTPARAPGSTVVYRVQPGDTDVRIAAWHGVPVAELRSLNDLGVDEPLDPGRTLLVPARPLPTYRVNEGDTLGRIAQRFGVELDALAHVNAIMNPQRIVAGTVLRIPATAQRTEVPRSARPRRAAPPPATPAVAAAPARTSGTSDADDGSGRTIVRPASEIRAEQALVSAEHAFEEARFEEALVWTDRAQQALPASSANAADQRRLAQAHLVRGMTEVALGRDAEARASFGRALAADNNIEFDPASVSPKVLTIFREVRGR